MNEDKKPTHVQRDQQSSDQKAGFRQALLKITWLTRTDQHRRRFNPHLDEHNVS